MTAEHEIMAGAHLFLVLKLMPRRIMMSTKNRTKALRQGFRDWLVGIGLFVVMAFGLSVDHQSWGPSAAVASSPVWSQPHEMATPREAHLDDVFFAAMYQPATAAGTVSRTTALVILGLTFSLMFSFNLFIWRHLRRAYANPRSVWRRN